MEFSITEKAAFTVIGRKRSFSAETAYRQIPAFWDELLSGGNAAKLRGTYGVCLDGDGSGFDYMIADDYDPHKEIPAGFETHTLPAGTWAVFPCRGPLPEALQRVNTAVWNEWVPSCREYTLGGSYSIEWYAPPAGVPEKEYSEIWVPVTRTGK